MYIRKAISTDAKKISYLIFRNAEKVFENNYTKAQIEMWKKKNTPQQIRNSLARREIFCAFEKNLLIGTIGIQNNEVVGLYVSHSKRKKGMGRKLLEHLEEYAKEKNIRELFLTSTPSAENFYKTNGYKALDYVELIIDGVLFKELKMTKNI